jgi:hypothetical protein
MQYWRDFALPILVTMKFIDTDREGVAGQGQAQLNAEMLLSERCMRDTLSDVLKEPLNT